KSELIAPCGMNCNVCSNYLAMENDTKSKGVKLPYCIGCRPREKKCSFVRKKCKKVLNHEVEFCYECNDFPCQLIKKLAIGYEKFYHMNMIDNLNYVKENGLAAFLDFEKKKWMCSKCGKTICCHNGICYSCDLEKMKIKKKRYRWDD
ncbi:DUF3795 domain-containing protein, partial [Candidatus Bathyarchaeota archaeon]|nr:DUF3795 domain-containing protein [Candidatus Bathyarchaeota archaeon]